MEQTEAVVLGEKKIEQLSRQPIIESFVSRSQDDKWIVHKTTITNIKPVSYFEKVPSDLLRAFFFFSSLFSP